MTGVHFLLRLELCDLLIIGGPGLSVGHAAADFLFIEGVAHRAKLVIGEAIFEILARGELALVRLIREKMRLDEIFHQHATAALGRQACDFGSDFGFGEGQLRIGNVGSVDARDGARVCELCAERQRECANA